MTRWILLSLVLTSLVLASCKTTEANYKAAYETTRAAQRAAESDDGLDEDTRRLLAAHSQRAHSTEVVGADTIDVTTLFVTMEQGSTDRVPRYSVTLNAFSQIFNARAMCKRLIDAGFSEAYIFKTATPDYYVAAAGSNSIEEVPEILRRVERAGNLGQRSGFPAVIRSGGWRPSAPTQSK